jgi:hypothetical protein
MINSHIFPSISRASLLICSDALEMATIFKNQKWKSPPLRAGLATPEKNKWELCNQKEKGFIF